ncbi:MAG: hypothetical protein AVDCRST_MAG93-6864, partial [uncultured Chloroflexia bacterium]
DLGPAHEPKPPATIERTYRPGHYPRPSCGSAGIPSAATGHRQV